MIDTDGIKHIVQARARPQIVSADVIDRYATVEALWAGGEWAESRSLKLKNAAEFDPWTIASR